MTTETNTTINSAIRTELAAIVRQAMEQHEQKAEADKTVYRRVCAELSKELRSFNYSKPSTYVNREGKTMDCIEDVSYVYELKNALSALLRIVYRANSVTKLPSENEADIKQFMLDTLERMKVLSEQRNKTQSNLHSVPFDI